MNAKQLLSLSLVGFMAIGALDARADVLTLGPAQAVVLPGSTGGRVAVMFDLAALPDVEGRVIDEAVLSWPVNGLVEGATLKFDAALALSPWTPASIAAGEFPAVAANPVSDWEVTPLDVERNGGGFIRFDLTPCVIDWSSGAQANRGVVISSSDWNGRDLADQLSNIRLTVRYGFAR